MFRRLDGIPGAPVEVTVDGIAMRFIEGDSLAAQMVLHGLLPFRKEAVAGQPRGPYCLIGQCFDCLVEVDGIAEVQACMTPVRAGMVVRRRLAGAEPDR